MSSLSLGSKRSRFKVNLPLVAVALVWLAATLYLIFAADLSLLRYGNREPVSYMLIQLTMFPTLLFMLFLARRAGLKPIDHTSDLGLTRTRAALETVWLLVYMFVTMGIGRAFNIHTHIHMDAFADGTQTILGQGDAVSSLIYVGFNFVAYAALPLAFFMGVRGYQLRQLLLKFPAPRVFVPFAIVVGLVGFLPIVTPEYWSVSVQGHILTLLIYGLGTLVPIAIFTQALLAPRLAFLARSWVTGSVLAGVAYMLFNLNEYFVVWGSAPETGLSLTWLIAADLFFGVAKGVSTLALGNAWMHVFTTHTFHLADAPLVAKVFGLR